MTARTLPVGWATAQLGEVCVVNPRHPRDTSRDLDVSFVPMAAVSDVLGEITDPEVRRFDDVRSGFTHFAEEDVLWAKITPCMENGKAAVARNLVNGIGCGTTEFFVLRSHGVLRPSWIHRFMRQESYRRRARATMKSGVGQARVPKDFVLKTEIPVAPLAEQDRVLAKVDALQAHSRRAREALDAIPALLERFRQSVLAAAFRGDLTADWRAANPDVEPASVLLERIRVERKARWIAADAEKSRARAQARAEKKGKPWGPADDEKALAAGRKKAADKCTEPERVSPAKEGFSELPVEWTWARFEEAGELLLGRRRAPEYANLAVERPYLRVANVKFDRLDLSDVLTMRWDSGDVEKYELAPNDILLSEGQSYELVGQSAMVNDEAAGHLFQSTLHRLRANPDFVLPRYAQLVSMAWTSLGVFTRYATITTNIAHLPAKNLKVVPFPLCSLAEQAEVCRIADLYLAQIAHLEGIAQTGASGLNTLDQAVLAKAFRGDLVPQDPDDEPASALLDRIRAEREAASPKKRKGGRR